MEPAQECAVFGGAETSSPRIHSEQRTGRVAGSCRGDYSALHNSAQRGSLGRSGTQWANILTAVAAKRTVF